MPSSTRARVLVAGLGNVFLGDDAFGVEVVRRLAAVPLPDDVRAMDVGLRSLHLAYELREHAYELVILVDAVSRGGRPGTLYLLDPGGPAGAGTAEAAHGHAILPHDVLTLVDQLGGTVPPVRIVGCEPRIVGPEPGLSPEVAAAIDGAVDMIEALVASKAATLVEP